MIRLIRYGIRQPQLSFQPILNLKRYRGGLKRYRSRLHVRMGS